VFERICTTDDVWEGELIPFEIGLRKIIVVHVDDKFLAYDARCPHQQHPLSDGTLEGNVLTCSAHRWQFDVTTGEGVNPKGCRLQPYTIKRIGSDLFLEMQQNVNETA
jgi:toluene monooxygenase system ferredoxin subunit